MKEFFLAVLRAMLAIVLLAFVLGGVFLMIAGVVLTGIESNPGALWLTFVGLVMTAVSLVLLNTVVLD